MALQTLSFDKLRRRNNITLTGLDFDPKRDICTYTNEVQEKIRTLFEQRAEIEDLASTENQRESYGTERWHESFMRLRDIHDRDFPESMFREDDAELQWRVWNTPGLIPKQVKIFQELYCHPHMITPLIDIKGKNISRTEMGTDGQDSHDLRPFLVNTNDLKEKHLEDLGLCDFSEDIRDPETRMKKKREATDQLKKLWEQVQPIDNEGRRIFIIRRCPLSVRERYHNVPDPDESILGKILYVREEGPALTEKEKGQGMQKDKKLKPPAKRSVQFFHSVYNAHRKTLHEAALYDTEITTLARMKEDLAACKTELDAEWDTRKDDLQREGGELLRRCANVLEVCEDRWKLRAHHLLLEASDFRDKSGKPNVSSAMAKITAAENALQSGRLGEIYGKDGYNRSDHDALKSRIDAHEHNFEVFRSSVESAASLLSQRNLSLFNPDSTLTPKSIATNAEGLHRRMGIDIHRLNPNQINLHPFITYRNAILAKDWDLVIALHQRDLDSAKDALIKMHVIGKMQALRSCIEGVKGKVIDADNMTVETIFDVIRDLTIHFLPRQIFPERTVDGYGGLFEDLKHELAHRVEPQLKIYLESNLSGEERQEMYKRLKEYLKRFDGLEEMVEKLP